MATTAKKAAKTSKAKPSGPKTMPPFPMEGTVVDKQSQFVRLTRSARIERDSERIFLASKLEMLRSHPGLSDADRAEAETLMAHALKLESREALEHRVSQPTSKKARKKTPPVPGGVGYGMFYTEHSARRSRAARRSTTRSSARISQGETSIRGCT